MGFCRFARVIKEILLSPYNDLLLAGQLDLTGHPMGISIENRRAIRFS